MCVYFMVYIRMVCVCVCVCVCVGDGKVWRIVYQFVFGGIKFGELLKAHSTGTWYFNKREYLANSSLASP